VNAAEQDVAVNKRIALDFLEHCFGGRTDQALALLATEASRWVLGAPDKLGVSGTRQGERLAAFLRKVHRGFPDGLEASFDGVTAEGERVAVEVTAVARLHGGGTYRNSYHFLLQVRDGKVLRVREYMDTYCVHELQQARAALR
jgi:ketosteroid isomerase-like protein